MRRRNEVIRMKSSTCDICGQPLTDASGHWRLSGYDRGINSTFRTEYIDCCTWCKESIDEAIKKVAEEHRKDREKWT